MTRYLKHEYRVGMFIRGGTHPAEVLFGDDGVMVRNTELEPPPLDEIASRLDQVRRKLEELRRA